MDVLKMTTSGAASFSGLAGERGSIKVGKAADMVLLDKNPLADMRNLGAVHSVILRGQILDSQ